MMTMTTSNSTIVKPRWAAVDWFIFEDAELAAAVLWRRLTPHFIYSITFMLFL